MNRDEWSDNDDEANEDVQGADLQKVQRQYRRLCEDRKSFVKGTHNVIRRQNAIITALMNENAETTTSLESTINTQNRIRDDEMVGKLKQLFGQNDQYMDEINEEKDKIQELDAEIRHCEQEIGKQNRKMGGVHESQAYETAIQKQVRILENRLDKAQVIFSTQLSYNHQLRRQIDHLRKERACLDNIYQKLTKELGDLKAEMAEVIESASLANEQRDELQNKMLQMQERNERDQAQFSAELKELERVIAQDEKLKQFMNIKAHDRAEYKEEEAEKKRRAGGSEKKLNHDRALFADYETAFERIKEITGKDDLNMIVSDFIKKEDDNFALFNFVNELSANTNFLSEQCDTIKVDMEKFREESTILEGVRKVKMTELEKTLEEVNKLTEEQEEKLREGHIGLDEIKTGIRELFDGIECDERPIFDLLGSADGIRDNNVMVYLGLIEQKTNELLAVQRYMHTKPEHEERHSPQQKEQRDEAPTESSSKQLLPDLSNIVPPSSIDEWDNLPSSDDEKPLSREEIKQKLQKQAHKKDPHQHDHQQQMPHPAAGLPAAKARESKKKKLAA